ncbi:hypothetical protein ACVWY5_003273 [Bradyrhizobium sp. USDA 3256]
MEMRCAAVARSLQLKRGAYAPRSIRSSAASSGSRLASIEFGAKDAFFMSDGVSIARTLASIYGNDDTAALGRGQAAALRLVQTMLQISQVSQDITRGVLTDFETRICNGASAMDAQPRLQAQTRSVRLPTNLRRRPPTISGRRRSVARLVMTCRGSLALGAAWSGHDHSQGALCRAALADVDVNNPEIAAIRASLATLCKANGDTAGPGMM